MKERLSLVALLFAVSIMTNTAVASVKGEVGHPAKHYKYTYE